MQIDETIDKYMYITGWVILGVLGFYAIIMCFVDFEASKVVPPCAIHALTGLFCPGCGGTRAVNALLHGKILLSAYYHPFVVYVAIVGGWFMLSQTIQRLSRGKARIGLHFRMIYMWIGLGLIAINCIVKNVIFFVNGSVWLMQ